MSGDAWFAAVGAVAVGLVVRLSNVVVAWLSRVLGVKPPEPIPTPGETLDAAVHPRPAQSRTEPPSEP